MLSQLSELAPNLALAVVGSSSWRLMEAGSGALASNAFINAPGARILVASKHLFGERRDSDLASHDRLKINGCLSPASLTTFVAHRS